jgi:hypothetical protein
MAKSKAKRVGFAVAILCYVGGVGCGIRAATIHAATLNDPLRSALIAAAIYLLLTGAIFHLATKAKLRSETDEPK